MASGNLRRVATRLLTSGPIAALASREPGVASVFMFHRFGREVRGHDPQGVRRFLEWLRRHRYEVLDLESLFQRLAGDGPPLRRAVALTIDDGYSCQAEIGASLFAEYDVPVTTFLATGFLDEQIWLWWDQVEYVLLETKRQRLDGLAGTPQEGVDLSSPAGRQAAIRGFVGYCKTLPDAGRLAAIAALARGGEVELPIRPPARYRPMTWEQARRLENRGMRFGPHTVTHPILARTDDGQAEREIRGSWQRLGQEVTRPVPVFCYPNGLRGDFGEREFGVLGQLGLRGAVTAEPGYASLRAMCAPAGRFRVPRFSFSESADLNVRYASRVELLLAKLLGRTPE
jgi:peptidoglycan/xylan/chitin deacetylase (PgdA/CDA1 family)